ncbi:MAG TPA: hypothetical protein VD973_07500 [Symbiobacteriaceae bacterium]|nr:hypothetical protein [Symbiobacteriaceae bacterium]
MRQPRYLWVAVMVLSAAIILGPELRQRTSWWMDADVPMRAEWRSLSPYPDLPETGLWAADQPKPLESRAFGRLPPEQTIYLTAPQVQGYRLATELPGAPWRMPVYLVGRYPDEYARRLGQVVPGQDGWGFEPKLSLVDFGIRGEHRLPPIAGHGRITNGSDATVLAQAFLKPFFMRDTEWATAVEVPEGWRVFFEQRIGKVPIYGDKPIQAHLSPDGDLIYALGRRRPVLYRSSYTIRSSKAAWLALSRGKGYGFTLLHGAPPPSAGEEFVVTRIELCYLVPHVNTDLEVMQPHWAFWNAAGKVLFVPAVADPYVTWPKVGG